uniref:Protein FMC1 homolog n=1 Tax=Acrobeloides nanus TaxID=290746 RepID=A0A914C6J9_9BILA
MSSLERSRNAIPALRQIVSELRKSNGKLSRESREFKFLMNQMRTHQPTQRIFSKAPNEMEHLAQTYATYLHSTRMLAELQEKYSSGERSIEDSAKLVGLQLPEKK